jgi:nitrosocyanin
MIRTRTSHISQLPEEDDMQRAHARAISTFALGLFATITVVAPVVAKEKAVPAEVKAATQANAAEAKADVQMTFVAIEYEGTKLWLPGTIVAHKGDRVRLNLVNKIPSEPAQHGFAIDAFKVAEVVNRGAPTVAEFVANKTGVFPIYCQFHPAHVGGQLIVLERAR